MKNKAMIFGVSGQTGSYLAEHLLKRGDEVIGITRRTSINNYSRIKNCIISPLFKIEKGDISDFSSVANLIKEYQPDWIFNMAAQSHVGVSFNQPLVTMDVTCMGQLNLLEAVRLIKPDTRIYFAGSSEEFGSSIVNYHQITKSGQYQDLNTPKQPCSPYAVAKVAAHNLSKIYRDGFKTDVRVGVLGNHESPRRGEEFVTRKITKFIGRLHRSQNKEEKLYLGNLDAKRDWGHAREYAEGIIKIMEYPTARDFLIGTGETRTVKEFLELAFGIAQYDYSKYVEIDDKYKRPVEVPYLRMMAEDTYEILNWRPTIKFEQLVEEMVRHDMENEYD